MDSNGYPTNRELATLKRFKFQRWQDVLDMLEHIRELWNWNDTAFVLKGKTVLRLELHTYGWSGNESIVEALMDNPMFWSLFWQSSRRGGHYTFKISKSVFNQG